MWTVAIHDRKGSSFSILYGSIVSGALNAIGIQRRRPLYRMQDRGRNRTRRGWGLEIGETLMSTAHYGFAAARVRFRLEWSVAIQRREARKSPAGS